MQFLPGLDGLGLLLLACLAFFVEKYYAARWTVVANCVILLSAFGIGALFGRGTFSLYLAGSILAAAVTALSYINRISLFGGLYLILHLLYSSKTVLGIVLAAMFNALSSAVIFIALIWIIAIYYFGHPLPSQV